MIRPSGPVAVVVPSESRRSCQPHRWITIRWWNRHSGTRLESLVRPPLERGMRWWTSQALAAVRHPGKAHRGWRSPSARRRCGGITAVGAPTSSGRLTVESGPPRRARNAAASPPGRSEEHTSELQSQFHLVCRLLLEKKKKKLKHIILVKKKKKKIKIQQQ